MASEPHQKLTPEAIAASAAQYKSRVAWQRGDPAAYNAARRLRLFEAVCQHMPPTPRKHTLESLRASAAPYESRSEWKEADQSAYICAYQRGLLDDVCAHMTRKLRPSDYWTLERCMESAAAYTSRLAWAKGDISAHKHASKNGWLEQCCAHMPKYRPAGKWTRERIEESAKQFSSKKRWHQEEHGAYDAAKRLGIFEEVTAHMPNQRHRIDRDV